ncbi:GerAB/ArcD/ProY family transporter [Paenibacillus flagellatus]|uniref:Spore gernimation protein n=1 Tax=Paenibacillus flagellatus TaxID=2211139 RepID=A0A2V5K7I8_9BACL|nr:endospore germination permease [Paenibacillus flagellatus]PYI53974.1 spore gernimation protein [Paenibacillus flagellatus]
MSRTAVRVSELVVGLVLFEIGSTPLFLLGGKAKRDAWLAMGIGAAIGFVLLLMYLSIHRRDPERDLFELCRRYWGRWAGALGGLAFSLYFAYETSRNLRDLGELTVLTLLVKTPLFFIMIITIAVVANTVLHGAEVLFWTCLTLFPIVIGSYALIVGLIAGVGLIHPELMLPVLDDGWKPVWDSAFPEIVSFPFGQTALFLVFLPMAKRGKRLSAAVMTAYGGVAVFLIAINQINILVLGPMLAANATFPLLQTVQLIQIAEVFERMDILFALLLYLGLGIKMAAFYTGAVIGLEKVTGIAYKKLVVPTGAAIYAMAFLSPSYTHHIWTGLVVFVNAVSPVFQMALPALLFVAMLVRRNRRGRA